MTTPILFDIAQRLEQLSKDLNVLDRLANALQASAEPGAQPIGAEHTLLIPLGTMTMDEIKRAVLEGTLRFTNGNRSHAARLLGVNAVTVFRHFRKAKDAPST